MALIQTSLIWVAYAVAIAILLLIASIFVYVYQKPRERAISVTTVCILTVSALLATVLLLPVDIALVSSTVSSKTGLRKEWATQDRVDSIVYVLKNVYYALYALDAVLCLLVVPFAYFLYEEYDEVEAAEGSQSVKSRLLGAAKYTTVFLVLCIVLFLVGFFIPAATYEKHKDRNLDYFKDLLTEGRSERALTFALGLLITLGTLVYTLYTGAGLALLPVTLIRSAPAVSAPSLAATTESDLSQNRERQRQIEARSQGRPDGPDASDRRELEALVSDERRLVRRERLAAETTGEGHLLMNAWAKTEAFFRPIKLLGGLFLLLVALLVWVSMLITAIDKAKNSICKQHCGYLLGATHVFQPLNYVFVMAAKVFPIDYVLFLLLVLFFFSASVIGIATVGIRFLWITLFKIRKGKTSPQAMLMATVLLALMVLAINYAMAMIVAPQYTTFGPQTYCDRTSSSCCSSHPQSIKPCSELAKNPHASATCTPSVASTFINRIMVNFPVFGAICFWAQFAFLGLYLATAVTTLFRAPRLETDGLDEDLAEEEEEGLLGTTGRRFNAAWQDVTGRARRNNPRGGYGTTAGD